MVSEADANGIRLVTGLRGGWYSQRRMVSEEIQESQDVNTEANDIGGEYLIISRDFRVSNS
jgi:hypothetical protein